MYSLNNMSNNQIQLNYKDHKKHILFSGTQVIQTRKLNSTKKVKAIVLRTGKFEFAFE
jgi:hypothetical protein